MPQGSDKADRLSGGLSDCQRLLNDKAKQGHVLAIWILYPLHMRTRASSANSKAFSEWSSNTESKVI